MLRMLSEKKERYFYEQNLGRTVEVLFEQTPIADTMEGFSDNYIRVTAPYNPGWANTL